jgi:hypothetical protein
VYTPAWLLDPASGVDFVAGKNPYAVPGPPYGMLEAAGGALLSLAMAGTIASLVVRFRKAAPVEQLQLKWIALAGLIIVTLVPVCIALYGRSDAVQALTPVVLSVAALGLCAAVLRYRLFDIDLIVNRTVVYLTLSVLLAAAYGATVIALGAILGGYSSWTAASATLVAAVGFRPLRRGVQGIVDRRFDRAKYDAGVRIDGFLERLRAGTEQPERVEDLLREVLHDPTLRVLLLLPASGHTATSAATRPPPIPPGQRCASTVVAARTCWWSTPPPTTRRGRPRCGARSSTAGLPSRSLLRVG